MYMSGGPDNVCVAYVVCVVYVVREEGPDDNVHVVYADNVCVLYVLREEWPDDNVSDDNVPDNNVLVVREEEPDVVSSAIRYIDIDADG